MKLTIMTLSILLPMNSIAVEIDVLGIRGQKGQVLCYLFSSDDGFPTEESKALEVVKSTIDASKNANCVFQSKIYAASAAISVIHDEDMNGKMSTNFIGIPKEGWCTSNNAKAKFGPPKYEDAKFKIQRDSKLSCNIVY